MIKNVKAWFENHIKKSDRVHMMILNDSGSEIEWISKENDEKGDPLIRRKPNPVYTKYKMEKGFTVVGCCYKNLIQLNVAKQRSKSDHLYRDAYGRKMLYFKERYPCFDCFDYMTEDRYYHWYLFNIDDRLICVHYGDDTRWISVTEDVSNVRDEWLKEMKKIGWAI